MLVPYTCMGGGGVICINQKEFNLITSCIKWTGPRDIS